MEFENEKGEENQEMEGGVEEEGVEDENEQVEGQNGLSQQEMDIRMMMKQLHKKMRVNPEEKEEKKSELGGLKEEDESFKKEE